LQFSFGLQKLCKQNRSDWSPPVGVWSLVVGLLYLHLSTQQANNMQKTRIAQYNIPFCILRKTKKR